MNKKSSLQTNVLIASLLGLLGLIIITSCNQQNNHSASSVKVKEKGKHDPLESGFGQRKKIKLSDSLFVTLNSHSRIKLSRDDSLGYPEILLDGDAFFEIPPQDTPWVVLTGMLKLMTRGASFRVHAHQEHAGQSLEVLKGELTAIKAYSSDYPDTEMLHAGGMILINKDIDLMEKETFDTSTLVTWKNDILTFNQTPVYPAIRQLEDWYGVEIEITGNFPETKKITAQFNHQTLEQVLQKLKDKGYFDYQIKENKVFIKN